MNFTFTEEQLLIRDMAERFFRDEYDLDTRRKHQAMPGGFCPETWAQFAEMGWLALGIPEDLLKSWTHPGKYVSGRELIQAGLAERLELEPPQPIS